MPDTTTADWYHQRCGHKARKCLPPCQGNDRVSKWERPTCWPTTGATYFSSLTKIWGSVFWLTLVARPPLQQTSIVLEAANPTKIKTYGKCSFILNPHWLPICSHIHFKILLLTFKAVHGLSPSYLRDLISVKSDSSYNLRSNVSLFLEPPKGKMLPMLVARSFHAAAPSLWNSLPRPNYVKSNCLLSSNRSWRLTFFRQILKQF
jgi:hypothetical protein